MVGAPESAFAAAASSSFVAPNEDMDLGKDLKIVKMKECFLW